MKPKYLLSALIAVLSFTTLSQAQTNKYHFINTICQKGIGDNFIFIFPEDRMNVGVLNQVTKDLGTGITLISGTFQNLSLASFRIEIKGNTIEGLAFFHAENSAYRISAGENETVVSMIRVPLDEVMCIDHSRPEGDNGKGSSTTGNKQGTEIQMVPLLESLPGANCVLYLDFDGETVSGTSWNSTYNSGNPIVAAPSGLSNANVTDVWTRVAEDFIPFNINVTTDSNKYNAAPQGRRMKCIITPTDAWYPSSVGGVAYLNSFLWTGRTPCWVFITSNNKYIAEACSHELGHTLGLYHDGQTPSPTYYLGHGTGNVGWAPIMGAGYYEYVSQWSIGEYTNANNQEDDVAKIASTTNTFGYRPDDHANTSTGATPLVIVGNSVSASTNKGIIELRTDVDVFQFTKTSTFNMNLSFQPGLPGPNLDILVELYDANSTLVLANNVTLDLYANIVLNNIAPGTYYLHVSGVGYLVPSTGYSDYASIGQFGISGTITTVAGAVTITPQSAITFCGSGSAILQASSGFTSYTWAPAASLSASTGQTVTATPTVTTTYTVTAVPPSGPNTQAIITVTINPLPVILSSPSSPAFCAGDSVLVTASGASTYSWLPVTGLSNPNAAATFASPSVTTTYTITGTDANGCIATSTTTVIANPLPTISITNSLPSFCIGDSTLLNVTGNSATVLWSPASGLSCTTCLNPISTATTTTTYTVTGTGVGNCTATAISIVTVNPLPVVQFNTMGMVCLDWLPFTLNTATPSGGSYSGPGVSSGTFDPNAAGAGTHILTYTYTDVNGCTNSDTTVIVVDLCAGTNELQISNFGFQIYPNPFTETITISGLKGATEIMLYNILGELILIEKISTPNSELETPNLQKGVYFIQLKTESGSFVKKLVKE